MGNLAEVWVEIWEEVSEFPLLAQNARSGAPRDEGGAPRLPSFARLGRVEDPPPHEMWGTRSESSLISPPFENREGWATQKRIGGIDGRREEIIDETPVNTRDEVLGGDYE
jgi:hypothetical protein